MPAVRNTNDQFLVQEWTQQINNIDNQYGLLNELGVFNTTPVSQTAIVFDKNENTITLLPDADRKARKGTYGKDRDVANFSLPLAYFDHSDFVTPEDIQNWRQAGTPDTPETVINAKAQKLEDLKLAVDQTHEFMKIQAIKGISTTPDGTVLADMFTEFNITLKEVDFLLGTATTNVDAKIAEVKRHVAANLKGSVMNGRIWILCDESFFDKLISHPTIREAYLNSVSNVRYQDDLSRYMKWGVSDVFDHRGVMFATYPATFNKQDGSTVDAFATDEGYAVPQARDLFRGHVGPSNKLGGANQPGSPMFAFEYRDPKDENIELQVQSAPLFYATKPACVVKVTTSN